MPGASVAVVVTTCDYGRFLEACLRSLDAQTRPPDRLVIVDDASRDDTRAVLDRVLPSLRLSDRILVHRNPRRLGLAGSLNLALRELTDAELVAHVDADDLVRPRYLQAMSEALARHPEAAYAYPRIELTGAEQGVYATHPFDPARLVFEGNYIPNVCLVRRSAVLAVGGYRQLATHLDWDLWLALLDAGHEGVLVDEVLYDWRRHGSAMSHQPLRRRLGIRAGLLWRHRRSVRCYAGTGGVWAWRAVRRGLRGAGPGVRRSASGWVEAPATVQPSKRNKPRA